jgi:hypothetical protein
MPSYRSRQKRIARLQEQLEAAVPEEAWNTYLDIEALVNTRHTEVVIGLVKWAFEQGRRSASRRP